MTPPANHRLKIAVIGGGISGLSAAWLLAKRHNVTLFEKDGRLGGHSHTVIVATEAGTIPVDMGFIVYTTVNYPNLTALFQCLDVASKSSNMSFAVSLGGGAFEYAGNSVASLFAQKQNLLRPRFWSMLQGILRFYRQAPRDLSNLHDPDLTLGAYLRARGYGSAFERDHLLPMAGAIWSAPPNELLEYPARSFIQFFANHGLLKLTDRPQWRTVDGGSRSYVVKLAQGLAGQHSAWRTTRRDSPRRARRVGARRKRRGQYVRPGNRRDPRRPSLGIARRSLAGRAAPARRLPL